MFVLIRAIRSPLGEHACDVYFNAVRQTNERTDNNGFAKSCHECDDHTMLSRRKLYKLSFQSFFLLKFGRLRALFGSEEAMHA